jgi:hypothetical protein
MIHPNLAMLAVVTTDYPLEPGEAIDFRPAVHASFNSISVDGECPTNDAVILLASGVAAIERTPATDAELALGIRTVCAELAHQIVADGEGATMLAEIAVSGAASPAEARAIAQRIATSSLVKTALFGRDANWGRVLAAAGSAPFNGGYAQLDPALVSLSYNARRCSSRERRRTRAPSTVAYARSTSTSDSATAAPFPDERPVNTTTCASTRSTGREPPRRESGRRGRSESAGRISASAEARGDRRGAGPRSARDATARHPVQFVHGRRRVARCVDVVRESLIAVNRNCARAPRSRSR